MSDEYSGADLCRILRLDAGGLLSCLRAALLPVSRATQSPRYSFQQLVVLRTAKGLQEAGVSVRQIRKVLDSLQRQLGDGAGLSSVKIYASGKRVVVWDGTSHWQPDSGQFLLNFDANQIHRLSRFKQRPRPGAPSESAVVWLTRAIRLQDDSPAEARRAYQEAIRLRPSLLEAHVNLGLLHHNDGKLKQAEACYRRALRYQPAFALAHFNLGVVLEDQGDLPGALAAYLETLRWAPAFRDAHCNLAQLYEHLGRQQDAVRHYAAAKRLPKTPTPRT
jgi:tetratricopeptide (TPR) repeat protein